MSFWKSMAIGFGNKVAGTIDRQVKNEEMMLQEGMKHFRDNFLPEWQKEKSRMEAASATGKLIGANAAKEYGDEYGNQLATYITKYGSGNPAEDLKLASMFTFKPGPAQTEGMMTDTAAAVQPTVQPEVQPEVQPTMGRYENRMMRRADKMGLPKDALSAMLQGRTSPADDLKVDTTNMAIKPRDPIGDALTKSMLGDIDKVTNREAVLGAIQKYQETGDTSSLTSISPVYKAKGSGKGGGSGKSGGKGKKLLPKTEMERELQSLYQEFGSLDKMPEDKKARAEQIATSLKNYKAATGSSTGFNLGAPGAPPDPTEAGKSDKPPGASPAAFKDGNGTWVDNKPEGGKRAYVNGQWVDAE
jgi:hypothetical protein